jgi:hypothetical protein
MHKLVGLTILLASFSFIFLALYGLVEELRKRFAASRSLRK